MCRSESVAITARRASVGAVSAGALALGAFALGAFAIGALAIGALAIRKLAVGHSRLDIVHIRDLTVDRLSVKELILPR